jgi:hypothetical protein
MPRPGATCGMGPLGRRTGDVRPNEMGGMSPRHILWLDPLARWTTGLAIVAFLFRRSCCCMSLPILTPEVCPSLWLVTS